MNAHQHLTGRRFWCSHLLEPQDLGSAEFMNPNRFHFQSPYYVELFDRVVGADRS